MSKKQPNFHQEKRMDIRVDVSSYKSALCLEYNDFEEWFESLEPEEKYISNFRLRIYKVDEYENKQSEIGYLRGNFFEAEINYDDVDFFWLCDMVSQELCNMAEAITKNGMVKESICEYDENIAYIDRIYIEPEYQNCGIGTYIINNLHEIMSFYLNLRPNVFILQPVPQARNEIGEVCEADDDTALKLNLKEELLLFYKRCGFKKVRGTDYMKKRV